MKLNKFTIAILMIFVSGVSFADCPKNMPGSGTIDCIINQAADEKQDGYRFVNIYEQSADDTNDEQASAIVSVDKDKM